MALGALLMIFLVWGLPAIWAIVQFNAAQRYSMTTGTVTFVTGPDFERPSSSPALNGCRVRYQYGIGGRTYTSEGISLENGSMGGIDCLVFKIDGMPEKGSTVEVFYNPERPEQALLSRAFPKRTLRTAIATLGEALLIMGGFAWVVRRLSAR